jgi:hypothetical protein
MIDINCQSFDVSGQFQVNIFHRKMHVPLPDKWPGVWAKSFSLFLLITEENACGSEPKGTSRFYIINRKTAEGGVPAISFLFRNKPDHHLPLWCIEFRFRIHHNDISYQAVPWILPPSSLFL